jgi:hypothetical protein
VTGNISIFIKLGVAIVSLLAAIAVYVFARTNPPEILAPIQALNADLALHQHLFESAPSAFYTLALGLFIGVCTSSRSSARLHCLIWVGLALTLELSQHSIIAERLADWTSAIVPSFVSTLIAPYWSRGIFDRGDVLATLLGGGIALYLLSHLPTDTSEGDIRDW